MKILFKKFSCFVLLASCFVFSSCTGDQFAAWRVETFDTTAITMSSQKLILMVNKDSSEEQHVRGIGFDKGSNSAGHFSVDAVKVGGQYVKMQDIIVPPGSTLTIIATYTPQNLETTNADYGGWETGKPEPFSPYPSGEEPKKKEAKAIHRSILQATLDRPSDGVVQIELVGEAVPGPNGEIVTGGETGVCTPGNGVACYTGGFSVDIPQLYSGGPKDLELTGAAKFTITGSEVTMKMDDFPPALMVLRSSEIPDLPPGITATVIISGGKGKVAKGTFDGTRLTIKDATFRIRFVLDELTADDISSGLAAMIDFEIPGLEITTTEPLSQGSITLHLETTLVDAPSGNPLFDQFLSNADVILVMKGQLTF